MAELGTRYLVLGTYYLMNKLAQAISVILHPLLMPTYFFGLLLGAGSFITAIHPSVQWLFWSYVLVSTFLIPVGYVLALKKRGMVSSIQLEKQEERWHPLLFTAIIYGISAFSMEWTELLPDIYPKSIYLMAVAIALIAIISRWWKISAHSVGVGGVVGMLLRLNLSTDNAWLLYSFLGMLLVGGVVMFARLWLQAHTSKQVWAGFGMGVLLGFLGSFV